MTKLLLRRFLRHYRSRIWTVGIASILLNVLVFAGSTYMLLVYDSVLPSGSVPTLLSLFFMLVVIYIFQFIFEALRSEAMLGLANGVHGDLSKRLHHGVVSRSLKAGQGPGDGLQPLRDLDQIHSFLSGAGPVAIIDLPWVIVFLIVLGLLHWTLGVTALVGVIVLAAISWASSRRTHEQSQDLALVTSTRQARFHSELRHAEAAAALGMRERLEERSAQYDQAYLGQQSNLSRIVTRFGGAGRIFRLLLQSLVLTVGALLVIDGKASGGIILAASILTGRALAPVDQAIANWRGMEAARSGWARIAGVMAMLPPPAERDIALPPPRGALEVRDLYVAAPGSTTPIISAISLRLEPGQALGVIGPSAAGKTTLAKAVLGVWPWLRGDVRLDGATHDQWDAQVLGASLGYVPQNVELVEGTIGENIARFDPDATSDKVLAAASGAGLDAMIKGMADGYETVISQGGASLSAGQRQRIGLARALYGDPHLLVLDEANSNLDAAGDEALETAITTVRKRGGMVIMVTHRPSTLRPVSHLAIMQDGRLKDFGPRDDVLERNKMVPGNPASGESAKPAKSASSSLFSPPKVTK